MTVMVVLLGALAPTVSRWVHASSTLPVPLALLEVCMTREGGASRIGIPASQAPADAAPASDILHLDHCPFCVLQGDGHGMPPANALASVAARDVGDAVPALFLQAPRPLHAWAAAAPRGPPLLSA